MTDANVCIFWYFNIGRTGPINCLFDCHDYVGQIFVKLLLIHNIDNIAVYQRF